MNLRDNTAHRAMITASICLLTLTLSACVTDQTGTTASERYSDQDRYVTSAAKEQSRDLPTLVVTNDPAPEVIYRRGSRDTVLSDGIPNRRSMNSQHVETLVTRKVAELDRDLSNLEREKSGAHNRLDSLREKNDSAAAKYYEVVADINTELQAGTTPGNPLLVERWNIAQDRLQALAESSAYLNGLATDLSDEASKAGFLQENIRAAYALSGAVKEDHVKLRGLEDRTNQTIVGINRLLTSVSDEINRRAAYLRSENLNLQTLSLAIAQGELYGQNLTNNLFKRAATNGRAFFSAQDHMPQANVAQQRRPLVIIRFDRPNVNYEQALYSAVSQALEKYPAAKFDLVAVHAAEGNPAAVALAATEARKNGEAVLRSLSQMGLPAERIEPSTGSSQDVRNSEVRIFIQ